MKQVKVLVVDDSLFMRKMITGILDSDTRIKVIGTAKNGRDALDKLAVLNPDVITLDIEMPILDGISTLKEMKRNHPCHVIMLSSLTKDNVSKAMKALALGAVDIITKPSGQISLDINKKKDEIIQKVLEVSKVHVVHKHIPKQIHKIQTINEAGSKMVQRDVIVAIGTSTGGPSALKQVLTKLPIDFPAPILIVQHMSVGYTKALAQRLNMLSELQVKEASDGELLEKGTAYIAPAGFQFRVRRLGTRLVAHVTKEQQRSSHQPSVDTLFESLAEQQLYDVYAVIMTGMGSDGANGLVKLKEQNEKTVIISESKKTAVVYGMPRAAEKTKLVDYVVDLNNISPLLLKNMEVQG